MSNAYAALFAIADADRDGVCGREEGFKFFQRFSVSQESLDEVWAATECSSCHPCPPLPTPQLTRLLRQIWEEATAGGDANGLTCPQFCEAMRLISLAQAAQNGGTAAPAAAPPTPSTPVTPTVPQPSPNLYKMNPSDPSSQEEAFRGLDADKDGVVSLLETQRFLTQSLQLPPSVVEQVCRMLSPTGSGFNLGGFRQAVLLSTVAKTKTPAAGGIAAASPAVAGGGGWEAITVEEDAIYQEQFQQLDANSDGRVNAGDVKGVFLQSKLQSKQLNAIWGLADYDKSRLLNLAQFKIAMHLIKGVREGKPVPTRLPMAIQPPDAMEASLETLGADRTGVLHRLRSTEEDKYQKEAKLRKLQAQYLDLQSELDKEQKLLSLAEREGNMVQAEVDKNVEAIKELAERRHQLDELRVQQQKAIRDLEIKSVEDKKQMRSLSASVGAIEQEIVELATHVAHMENEAMSKQKSLTENRTGREETEHEAHTLQQQLEDGRNRIEELATQTEQERLTNLRIKEEIAVMKRQLAEQMSSKQEKEAARNSGRRKLEEAHKALAQVKSKARELADQCADEEAMAEYYEHQMARTRDESAAQLDEDKEVLEFYDLLPYMDM